MESLNVTLASPPVLSPTKIDWPNRLRGFTNDDLLCGRSPKPTQHVEVDECRSA
jgi:hypothetical protein